MIVSQPFDVLGFFWDLIQALCQPFWDFLVGFLPFGDPTVFSVIDSIGQVGSSMSFNVFYFIDMSAVMVCFGVYITVLLTVNILKFVLRSMDMARSAVEMIPFAE